MAKSTIADRYLRTLENNRVENAPKSPPKSLRPATAVSKSPTRSPTKSPLKSENSGIPARGPASPSIRASLKPVGSTPASPIRDELKRATPAPSVLSTGISRLGIHSSPPTKKVESPKRAEPVKAEPLRSSPQKLGNSQKLVPESSGSPLKGKIGPPPDRNPTMHNQDLTPSQVSWDRERKNWQAYEYLCHVAEAKEWIEKILNEELPPVDQFPASLQNGVSLAKIVQTLRPDLMKWPIFQHKRLQYRHTENITQFFDLLEALHIPQLFLFDMTDLYEKRNLPKVIYCIHAVSHFIAESQKQVAAVDNLVGKLKFSEDQLNTTERGLAGHALPNFGSMTRQLSGKQPKLDPPSEKEDAVADDYDDYSDYRDEDYSRDEPRDDSQDDPRDSFRDYRRKYDDEYDEDYDDYDNRSPYRRNYRRGARRYSSDYDDSLTSLSPPPRNRYAAHQYQDSASEDDDSFQEISIKPPRRYRRDEYSDRVDSFTSSTRKVSRDMYHRRYNDRRAPRTRDYRDLSSTGSLRSRVLTSAEKMLIELESLEPEIIKFLAVCRGALVRRSLGQRPQNGEWVTSLQSVIRGKMLRESLKTKSLAPAEIKELVALQAVSRGKRVRDSLSAYKLEPVQIRNITYFQALVRGQQLRTLLNKQKLMNTSQLDSLIQFQTMARAKLVRNSFHSTTRGASNLVHFQSLARGVLARRHVASFKESFSTKDTVKSIVHLQSAFRGTIARFKLSCFYDDLDQHHRNFVKFQSLCRGMLVRRQHSDRRHVWNNNVDKVVLLQSYWRTKTQGSKYRTLVQGNKPNLEAIRPFLQLIDDKPEDFQMELELENIMKEISGVVKKNENLEAVIEQLDMKIALLVKNDISIDELVLQQQRQNEKLRKEMQQDNANLGAWDRHTQKSGGKDSNGLKEHFDPKTLQKPSRDRIEMYQGLLYILQTQSVYISRLMTLKAPRSLDIADLVLAVFGRGETPREMFFLLRQLAQSITQSTVGSAENTVSWCIISHLNRRPESTDLATKILAPAAKKIRAMADDLLEYDPHLIYEHLTGGGHLSAEVAIQDQAVQAVFVQNLHRLREISMVIVQSISEHAKELPYHIRFIAREVYREVLRASDNHQEAMAAVGQVVVSQFLQPALINADSLDLVDAAVGKNAKNLVLVGRVLHQIGLMAPFTAAGGTDIYLQPLNDFVRSRALLLSQCFQTAIVEAPDLQTYFGITELDDITMHERPLLEISMDNIFALHYMCYNNEAVVVTKDDTVLKPVIDFLGPLPRDAREMLDLARFKDVTLELNPKYGATALNNSNAGISSLFATAKRCLGYVLRVQSNQPDVMSVLIAPVELEDEHKYNLLLDSENTRESAGDLAELTFRDLKALTLEIVLELESSGSVSRQDDYQALINAIAEDIRNKDVVRQKRNTTLKTRKQTLESVKEKNDFLQNRVDVYSKHIYEAMKTLQTEAAQNLNAAKAKRFQKFQLTGPKPTSASDNTNARYGSYRVSADKLYEKSILIRLRGYSDRERKDIYFNFSSNDISQFQMDITSKNVLLPNGSIKLSLDELLSHQYQNETHIDFMSNTIQFSTNRLLQLLLSKFFGTTNPVHNK